MSPKHNKKQPELVDESTGEVLQRKVVYSNLNRRNLPASAYFKSDKPSKTVPDEALSIKKLFQRFATGIPLGLGKQPIFEEETGLPVGQGINPKTMDLCDWQEMRLQNAERNKALKEQDKRERKEAMQRYKEAQAKAQEQAEKQQQNPPGTNTP